MGKRYGTVLSVVVCFGAAIFFSGCSGEAPRPPTQVNVVENQGESRINALAAPDGATEVTPIAPNTFDLRILGQILRVLSPVSLRSGQPLLILREGTAPLAFPGLIVDEFIDIDQTATRQVLRVTVPVQSIGGILMQNVALPEGTYCVTARNARITDPQGRYLAAGSVRFCFIVYRHAGTVKSTIPTFIHFRLPQVGTPIEEVFLKLKVDPSAATLDANRPVRGYLRVLHANGSINLERAPVQSDGTLEFRSRLGGPILGPVSSVELEIVR
ncbi:MAG: hypothetical protein RMK62_12390 [Armatimonadota bacterium]|nr:hypothetical protein [Armatimonadota bacterium]